MTNKYGVLIVAILLMTAILAGCLPAQPAGNATKPAVTGQVTGDKNVSVAPTKPAVETPATEEEPAEEVKPKPVVDMKPGDKYFAKITLNEGELLKLDLQASDPDGDKLTYKYSEPLNANGEWQTKVGDAGQYPVTITASDGKTETSKTILVVVNSVNGAPVIQEPVKDVTVAEGEKVTLNLKAADPNDDILVWKFSSPIGADGSWQTKKGDAGEYPVTATVSDGYLTDSVSFKVKVTSLNHAPKIEIGNELTVSEGDKITLEPKVSDPDGDKVVVTYSGWLDSSTYTTGYGDAGKHEVTITASDGKLESTATVFITVNNVNRAPVISGLIVK